VRLLRPPNSSLAKTSTMPLASSSEGAASVVVGASVSGGVSGVVSATVVAAVASVSAESFEPPPQALASRSPAMAETCKRRFMGSNPTYQAK